MSSIVTDSFRELSLGLLKDDIDGDTSNYHVGLSQPITFQPDFDDLSSPYAQSKFRNALMSVKTLSNASYVVPLIEYAANQTYPEYNNDIEDGFYVLNSENDVFVCIETSRGVTFTTDPTANLFPSTVEPTRLMAGGRAKTFRTSDGYKWRYLFPLSNIAIATYKTVDWMPVKVITDRSPFLPITQESIQRNLQDSAVHGEILSLAIDSGGIGYDSAPSISIIGNGTGASFKCDVDGGRIVRVRVDSDGEGIFSHGSGYDFATVKLSSGDAVLRPVIGPSGGINANPIKTLKTKSLMVQVDFAGDEFDTILAQNDFNRVGVFRNLKNSYNDSDFIANTGNATKSLTITSVNTGSQFTQDEIFLNGGETAGGKVVYHDVVNNVLFYYQDEETGFKAFDPVADNTISASNSGTSATFSAVNLPNVDPYSGDLLYINNINANAPGEATTDVSRSDTQTEDIRIVIQLG
jgi:hypothetical protein